VTDEINPPPARAGIRAGDGEPVFDAGPASAAFVQQGLLFALNEFVFHGRGYQLIILPSGNLGVKGDGGSLRDWSHVDPEAVDAAMRRFRQLLLDAQGANKRVHQAARNAGHSPGFRTIGNALPGTT
jgi:hypothetical protein